MEGCVVYAGLLQVEVSSRSEGGFICLTGIENCSTLSLDISLLLASSALSVSVCGL